MVMVMVVIVMVTMMHLVTTSRHNACSLRCSTLLCSMMAALGLAYHMVPLARCSTFHSPCCAVRHDVATSRHVPEFIPFPPHPP